MTKHERKILIVTTSFPSLKNPSAGAFIAGFAKAMAGDMAVEVIAPSVSSGSLIDLKGCKVTAFRYAPKSMENLAQNPGGIAAALRKNKFNRLLIPLFFISFLACLFRKIPSVNYVQANWVFCGLVALLPCFVFRKKLVVTLHGEDVRKISSSFIHKKIFLLVARHATKIICVGEEMYQSLTKEYPLFEDKITFISNGVDDCLVGDCLSNTPVKKYKALIVGSLVEIKSIDHAIKAMARLRDRGACVELSIAGGGPLYDSLYSLVIDNKLQSIVRFFDVLPPDNLYELYRNSDFLIICSRGEGRSSVLMEAMATGLPVIGSDVPGVRELLDMSPGAISYSYGNIDQLVERISRMLEGGNLARLGQLNRQAILREGLLWSQTAQKYKSLFV